MSEPTTTNWACERCGASLCSRTAAAHGCGGFLTPAAVEAIACVLDLDEQYEMAEAVRAQDARWRALVGELLGALHDAPMTNVQTALWLWHDGDADMGTLPPTTRLLTALNAAQAALDEPR